MAEKDIQAKCLRKLKETPGVWSVKTIATNKGGVPDIICCVNGLFVAFEIKAKGREATPLQEYNGRMIRKSGGEWHLIDDYLEFEKLMGKILRKTGNPNRM